MRVTVLKEIPEDPDLSAAWNTLVLSMENPEVFFTYQWALAASRGFKDVLSTLLFLVYDFEHLAGVVALANDHRTPGAAFFLTSSTADYCDVVSAPGDRRAVILAVLEEGRKLGLSDLVLANVPANSVTLAELPQVAGKNRYYITSRTAYNCGVVHLGGQHDREALLRTLAGKNREKRALRRLTNLGSVKVIHVTEPQQIGASLESIVSAQISRFLASDRVSPLVGSERRAFLRQLSDLLSESGWLKISQLEIDGRPVAWNYGFRFGESWFWYLPTFEMEYAQVSPGSCLLRLLVEEAARDTSLRWLDLGLGDEAYKARYANEMRETRHVRVSRGFARYAVTVARESLSAAAARFPRLGHELRKPRTFFYSRISRIQEDGLVATVAHAMRKAVHSIASRDEVMLFEAENLPEGGKTGFKLVPLLREHLVEASILNAEDTATLHYLMRCSHRLGEPQASGFALQDETGRPVHFLWIENYDGFRLAEIEHSVEPSGANAAMIFDCWTPKGERGRGHYVEAVRQAAANLLREGRATWIFSGATNKASVRGVLKAGFQYRFSLVRQTWLGQANVSVGGATRSVEAAHPKRHTSAA